MEALFCIWKRIYGSSLLYMHASFHICEANMCIYGRSLPYMRMYKTEGRMHIRARAYTEESTESPYSLPYMRMLASHIRKGARVYGSQPAHIRKRTHIRKSFRICACWLHIYERKRAYTEESFHICAFCLPYMRIHGRQNAHIQKRDSVYACSLPYM